MKDAFPNTPYENSWAKNYSKFYLCPFDFIEERLGGGQRTTGDVIVVVQVKQPVILDLCISFCFPGPKPLSVMQLFGQSSKPC